MKFLILFLSILFFYPQISSSFFSFGGDGPLVKKLNKIRKRGIHLGRVEFSKKEIETALAGLRYNKNYQILEHYEIDGIHKDEEEEARATKDNRASENYSIFVYKIRRQKSGQTVKTIKFYYYRSHIQYAGKTAENKKPLLIISPTIKGIKQGKWASIEPAWADYFANHGFNVIILKLGEKMFSPERSMADLNGWIQDKAIDIRVMVDFANKTLKDEIDSKRVSLYGASLGGISSIIAMGPEPKERIAAGITVATGGNFADLWASSKQSHVARQRSHRMQEEGFNRTFPPLNKKNYSKKERAHFKLLDKHYKGLSRKEPEQFNEMLNREELYQAMLKVNYVEPLLFARLRKTFAQDIFMFISLRDTKVTTKTQLELWDALGRPAYSKSEFLNHKPYILSVVKTDLDLALAEIMKRLEKIQD